MWDVENVDVAEPWLSVARQRLVPRPPDTILETYNQQLLSDIRSLEKLLLLAKNLANDTLPPHVILPQELLAEVFYHVRDTEGAVFAGLNCSWISITQVCKRWRTLALSLPHLWTHLDSQALPPRLWSLVLRRSGTLLLHVHISIDFEWSSKGALEYFDREHSHRIFFLSLNGPSSLISTLLDTFASQPLPELRHLSVGAMIEHPSSLDSDDDGLWNQTVASSRQLQMSEKKVPLMLTNLRIFEVPFPWAHPIYKNVTDLTLDSISPYFIFTTAQFRSLLFRMDGLKALTLIYPAMSDKPIQTIELPLSLEKLSITCSAHEIPTAVISKTLSEFCVTTDVIPGFEAQDGTTRFLSRHAGASAAPFAYEISIHQLKDSLPPGWPPSRALLNVELRLRQHVSPHPSTAPLLVFQQSSEIGSGIIEILEGAYLGDITDATVDVVWDYAAPDTEWLAHWFDFLAQTPHIQRLVLSRRAYSQIVPVLFSNAFRNSEETEEISLLLPELQILVLKHSFGRAELGDSYQPLIEWLSLRKAHGAPIQELQIDQRIGESDSSSQVSLRWLRLQELVNVVIT